MHMTKKELVDQLRVAEHNQDAAEDALNQQAENLKDIEGKTCSKTRGNLSFDCDVCRKQYWSQEAVGSE